MKQKVPLSPLPIEEPTVAEISTIARLDNIELSQPEAAELWPAIVSLIAAAGRTHEFYQPLIDTEFDARDPGAVPSSADNPYNAFIRRCNIQGSASGPLKGWTVGVKDNIAVAGVPLTNGSALPPFVPTLDSVVVERILAAGGSIVGTLNMDSFGGGATGVTSAFGPARNPLDPTRSAGGSSGGAGAAVASKAVDAALGVDQGGSGRIPAAFCGLMAIKATHGLVPTFGCTPIDHTIDFITPIASTVSEVAELLEVIAGEDWRDPQWVRGPMRKDEYVEAQHDGVEGMRIAIVEEAITEPESAEVVSETMERSERYLQESGAHVERISVPWWGQGQAIFGPYVAHLVGHMFRTEGSIYGHMGYIDSARVRSFAEGRRSQSRDLGPWVKCWIIASRYLHDKYMDVPFARLHNARLAFRSRVSGLFDQWDLLVTPTVPVTAPALPQGKSSIPEALSHSPAEVAFNTSPLNLSGHPAVCVPGLKDDDGLPSSVQVIAGALQEYSALRAAFVLEHQFNSEREAGSP